MRSGRHETRSAEEARLRSVCPFSLRELRAGPAELAWTIGRAEKLLFNIGRIPVRQSRLPSVWRSGKGKSCRRAEKGLRRGSYLICPSTTKRLKCHDIFCIFGMARSLLFRWTSSFRKAAPRVQRHVRSSINRVFPGSAAKNRAARGVTTKRSFRGVGGFEHCRGHRQR
jgi:hypothetical protein